MLLVTIQEHSRSFIGKNLQYAHTMKDSLGQYLNRSHVQNLSLTAPQAEVPQ
jgi:hypothetical protein